MKFMENRQIPAMRVEVHQDIHCSHDCNPIVHTEKCAAGLVETQWCPKCGKQVNFEIHR